MSNNSNPLRAEFASRLRELRVPRGFRTARAFAQALGIDENRYTRYERAEVEPDLALLTRMCTLLGLTPNDLLGFPAESGRAPGFAESVTPEHFGGVRSAVQSDGHAAQSGRALAWTIACRLAAAELGDDGGTKPLKSLERTTELFSQIETDAYGFAARAAASPAIRALAPEHQAEIVDAMNRLLSGLPPA